MPPSLTLADQLAPFEEAEEKNEELTETVEEEDLDTEEQEATEPEDSGASESEEDADEEEDDLQSRLDTLEKRRKDTEKSFQRERQERLAREKKIEELEARLKEIEAAKEEQTDEQFREEYTENDIEAVLKLRKELKAKNQDPDEIERRVRHAIRSYEEDKVRSRHEDYDEVVEFLVPLMESQAAGKAREYAQAGDFESAYTEGRRIMNLLNGKTETPVKTTKKTSAAETLSRVNSKGAGERKPRLYGRADDVMNEVFG